MICWEILRIKEGDVFSKNVYNCLEAITVFPNWTLYIKEICISVFMKSSPTIIKNGKTRSNRLLTDLFLGCLEKLNFKNYDFEGRENW